MIFPAAGAPSASLRPCGRLPNTRQGLIPVVGARPRAPRRPVDLRSRSIFGAIRGSLSTRLRLFCARCPADSHRRPHSAGHCPTSSRSDARRYGWSSRPRRGASRSAREHAPTFRNCHCEPVTESLVWQSASPVFKLPPSRRLRGTRRATSLYEGGKDTPLRRLHRLRRTDAGRGPCPRKTLFASSKNLAGAERVCYNYKKGDAA